MNEISSLPEIFNKAIEVFTAEGKYIDGVYDLLIRGSVPQKNQLLVEHYSDLDTSIIVEKVTEHVLEQVKSLYDTIKRFFPYKLSITLVCKADYLSMWHHHGIKPLFYQYALVAAHSVLKRPAVRAQQIPQHILQFDCLSNVAYLIHDLRNKYFLVNLQDVTQVQEFFCHLLKRAKHITRNAFFIKTGYLDENINRDLFKRAFPSIDSQFLDSLDNYKRNFEITVKQAGLKQHINSIFAQIERIHEELLRGLGQRATLEEWNEKNN